MADSGNKTEQPTPKRLKDGVKEGQVARSADLSAWASLLGLVLIIPLVFAGVSENLQTLFTALPEIATDPNMAQVKSVLWAAGTSVALSMLPLFLVTVLASQVAGWAQGGARLYLKRVQPKGSRISMIGGAKRIYGTRALWELAKQILKLTVIGSVLFIVIRRTVDVILGTGALSLDVIVRSAADEARRLVLFVIAAGLLIAIADYYVSKRRVRKELMMTRREVKEEGKQAEGDPLVRSMQRQRGRALAMSRMMFDVPTADVVLVNPTHVAVALVYRPESGAPRVVAKGAGTVATRIRQIATENRVPMVEDIPLARSIYRSCDIGTEIPEELYAAVARVLAFIMTLKRKGAQAGLHRASTVRAVLPRG